MSTIGSTQEAYEALCNGELFQVGGRYINPADIVEVDPNGGQNPIFRLADGRTVQHDRFRKGDVGDFLADALEYATRGQAQSEAIKVSGFSRVLIFDGNFTLQEYEFAAGPEDVSQELIYRGSAASFSQDNSIAFGGGGVNMYIMENLGDCYHYTLSTPWDVTTATQQGTLTPSAGNAYGVDVTPDGERLFITEDAGKLMRQYDMSTPHDLTTASAAGNFSYGPKAGSMYSPQFRDDGTRFYLNEANDDLFLHFECGTAFDITTASFVDEKAKTNGGEEGLILANGTKLFSYDGNADARVYDLPTPYSLSGATLSNTFPLSGQSSAVSAALADPVVKAK